VAGGFAALVSGVALPLDGTLAVLLPLLGSIVPVIGIWVMRKDADRFGKVHRGRVAAAAVLGAVGVLVLRSTLRVLAKQDDLSSAFMVLRVQAAADVLVAALVVFALWTLSSTRERALLVGGALLVLVASGVTAMLPTLLMEGSDIGSLIPVATVLFSFGGAALALAAVLFGWRLAKEPERPLGAPFALG
jgi:hypothetical protein